MVTGCIERFCVFVCRGDRTCVYVISDEWSVHVQFTMCAGDAAGLCYLEPEGSSSGFRCIMGRFCVCVQGRPWVSTCLCTSVKPHRRCNACCVHSVFSHCDR